MGGGVSRKIGSGKSKLETFQGSSEMRRVQAFLSPPSSEITSLCHIKLTEYKIDDFEQLQDGKLEELIDFVLQSLAKDPKTVNVRGHPRTPADYEAIKTRVISRIEFDSELTIHEFISIFEQEAVHSDVVRRAKFKFDELDIDHSGTLESSEIDKGDNLIIYMKLCYTKLGYE